MANISEASEDTTGLGLLSWEVRYYVCSVVPQPYSDTRAYFKLDYPFR